MILFSAPANFLAPELRSEWEERYDLRSQAVRDRADLPAVPAVRAWIPDPGQTFVAGAEIVESFPALEIVVTPSTGSNHLDREALEAKGIAVRSLLDDRASLDRIRASSEFTLLLVLASLRRFPTALAELDAGRWRHREEAMRGREVEGRRIGIVGLGRNGANVADWLGAMGAEVRYYDPAPFHREGKVESLEELFGTSEVVVLTLPLQEDTKGLVNRTLLERLPEGAHLINTSRGEIIAEPDLVAFLANRPDVAYAADVVCGEVEGRPLESPLYELYRKGRILLTPHIAGATVDSQTKAAVAAVRMAAEHLGLPA
jgi:phosphoglycerate dehydrogenase-like enzyme